MKTRIGLFGARRGSALAKQCQTAGTAELVAICDRAEDALESIRQKIDTTGITFYTNWNDFIEHDMDAVILANCATEHAPYAVQCLNRGLHVLSELLPCQTLQEAVALVEAAERSGCIYAYAENCCFMAGPKEMTRLFKEGKIGDFEYADCEYIHDLEPIAPEITYGDPNHWRNTMYATFYCTHSLGPIIHATGLRPVSVTGTELPFRGKNARIGQKSGLAGIEMVTLENGAVIKSLHGSLPHYSLWYAMYGSKGHMETARYIEENGNVSRILINANELEGQEENEITSYIPEGDELDKLARNSGHSGSDFYVVYNWVEKIQGRDADIIDVYEALDMFLPGLLGYRSILQGSVPVEIPNFRLASERDKYRNDTACTDPAVAGEQLLPSYSKGNPEIPDAVYDQVRKAWERKRDGMKE